MYRISVPMISRTFARDDRERVVRTLREMGAFRVVLAIGAYHFEPEVFEEELAILRDNVQFLHERGFEVSAWMWSFMDARAESEFTRVRYVSGQNSKQSVCCTDPRFRAFAANYLQRVALSGVDMVLYDDDYRYGYIEGGNGCLCDNHLGMMRDILGEPVTREQVAPYLMSGGENRYRSAWQRAKRESLLGFATEMRAALDKVAPTVRLGLCACFSVWDLDGVSADEISRALAGNTKPFLRLIGAPYWAVRRSMGGHRLQDVIELERMLRSFCAEAEDMEIVAEGDTYPRPRWVCPAANLEGFDTAMRADGRLDGILKYALDYTSFLTYETGYVRRHMQNLPTYAAIDELFGDKTAVGVRVWETMRKYETGDIPPAVTNEKELSYLCFSYAARMLAAASIPTTYDATDCVGIAFGESARTLPTEALKNGMILDLPAARILTQRGVDVGLLEVGARCTADAEMLLDTEELVALQGAAIYRTRVSERARVDSIFPLVNPRTKLSSLWESNGVDLTNVTTAAYAYENEQGERFFVLCFDGQLASDFLLRHYARGRRISEALAWLGRREFPVRIDGNPDLYVMAKREGETMTVGLWNFCPDAVDTPVVTLDGDYTVVRTIGCEARADGRRVTLSRLEPYGFAAFEVKK